MTAAKKAPAKRAPSKKAPAKKKRGRVPGAAKKAREHARKHTEPVKRPVGRPTKYDPSYCEVAINCGREGYSLVEIAVELGVIRDTLYNWMEKHEEFFRAIKTSQELAAAYLHKQFRKMAHGQIPGGNPTSLIFLAKNQAPQDFRDRKEHELTGPGGGPVQTDNKWVVEIVDAEKPDQ